MLKETLFVSSGTGTVSFRVEAWRGKGAQRKETPSPPGKIQEDFIEDDLHEPGHEGFGVCQESLAT